MMFTVILTCISLYTPREFGRLAGLYMAVDD